MTILTFKIINFIKNDFSPNLGPRFLASRMPLAAGLGDGSRFLDPEAAKKEKLHD